MVKIQGIERYEPLKKRSKVLTWIKNNALFCAVQGVFLACMPIIVFLSAMVRGYQAIGSEIVIIFAPTIYKVFKYILEYDERSRR